MLSTKKHLSAPPKIQTNATSQSLLTADMHAITKCDKPNFGQTSGHGFSQCIIHQTELSSTNQTPIMESVHERNFAAICIIQNIKGLKRSKAILETDMACEVGMF